MLIKNEKGEIVEYECDGCVRRTVDNLLPEDWRNLPGDRHYCKFCREYFFDGE